jgi:signal transduction histidine kinase
MEPTAPASNAVADPMIDRSDPLVTAATDRVEAAYELLERRISAFAQVAASMTVDQPLEAALGSLTELAVEVSAAEACAVIIVDPDRDELALFASTGLAAGYGDALARSWHDGVRSPSRQALVEQKLTVVRDARANGLGNPKYAPLHPYLREADWDDMVVVPLDSRGRSLGVLQYYLRRPVTLDDDERAFMTSLADQAALAAANASLFAQSERAAALIERQRLARELHDSVSQALFSMTLHARAAERHLSGDDGSPNPAALAAVRKLTELTQGALAEMRALIFELRPGALLEEGLVAALSRQAAALTAREGVPIRVSAPSERPPLDADAEEHLYRLVLEALHNAVKHARASRITVSIDVAGERMQIVVADDGVGFDPAEPHPGHLGQHTMADRAAHTGGQLRVESSPGAGTRVKVTAPLARS